MPGLPSPRSRSRRALALLAAACVGLMGACSAPRRPVPVLDGPVLRSATEDGDLRVVGTVTNLGALPADYLRVVIRVEDEEGNEIAAASTPVEASLGPASSHSTLRPFESAAFETTVPVDAAQTGRIRVRFEFGSSF